MYESVAVRPDHGVRLISPGADLLGVMLRPLTARLGAQLNLLNVKRFLRRHLRPVLLATSSVLITICLVAVTGAQQKHPVTLSDLESLGFPDVTLQLSPDGKTLAYALSNESIWLVETRSGAQPRKIGAGFLPVWSPNGDRLAFYSTGSDGIQLCIYDPKSGKTAQITHLADGIDPDPSSRVVGWVHDAFRYCWSPDGKRIVFPTRVAAQQSESSVDAATAAAPSAPKPGEPLVLTTTTPIDWTLSGIFAHPSATSAGLIQSRDGHSISPRANPRPGDVLVNELFVVDIESGKIDRLSREDFSYFNPDWSPDGSKILCASSDQSGPVFGAKAINLYTIDAASGKRAAITTGDGVRSRPVWSSDGKQIAYLGSEGFFTNVSVFTGPADGSGFRNATKQLDRQVENFEWSADGKSIIVGYKDGVSMPLARLDLSSGTVENISNGNGTNVPTAHGLVSVSGSGAMCWQQNDPVRLGTLQYLAPGATEPVQLVDLYPQLREWNIGTVEVVRWKNKRGDEMEGSLLKPPDLQPGKKYPLIVDAYPLVSGTDWTSPMMGNLVWASMGYVVFRPSPRAPHVWVNPWKSAQSTLEGKGPGGWDVMVDDVLSGLDAVIKTGLVDPERMGLYGFSNGGGVADYLVTQTNRFKCAVAVAGVYPDWMRPILFEYDGFTIPTAGINPWDDPQGYLKLSAVFHLKQVNTPMLLADGDNDGDFLLGMIEMYNGLRYLGKDVTFIRYPNQGHGFYGPAMHDFFDREMAFFDKYLKK